MSSRSTASTPLRPAEPSHIPVSRNDAENPSTAPSHVFVTATPSAASSARHGGENCLVVNFHDVVVAHRAVRSDGDDPSTCSRPRRRRERRRGHQRDGSRVPPSRHPRGRVRRFGPAPGWPCPPTPAWSPPAVRPAPAWSCPPAPRRSPPAVRPAPGWPCPSAPAWSPPTVRPAPGWPCPPDAGVVIVDGSAGSGGDAAAAIPVIGTALSPRTRPTITPAARARPRLDLVTRLADMKSA